MDDSPPLRQAIFFFAILLVCCNQGHAQQAFTIEPDVSYSATEGDSVLMLCSVSNKEGALTWVMDGVNAISADRNIIDPTLSSKYLITGDDISGSFNLQIVNVTVADSGTYVCRVSAAGASSAITSREATLTVTEIPIQAFTTEPSDAQATSGNSVTLQCVVENKEGTLEWSKDGVVISSDSSITDSSLTRYSITGNAANGEYNLQIVTLSMDDAGTYACRVTAAGLSGEIVSGDAVLTVSDASQVQNILIPPSDVTATEGTSATLVCYVSALSGDVLWLKDGVQMSMNRELVNGDTSGRVSIIGNDEDGEYHLFISVVQPEDQALYFCVLSQGSDGDPPVSSAPATLTVLDAVEPSQDSPVCTLTPSSGLREDDVVTLTCESTGGMPQPTLTWSNDLEASGVHAGNQTLFSSHTTNSLTLTLTTDLSGVVFACRSTHPAYTSPKECSLAPLTFELVATINVSVAESRLTIEEEKPGEILCSASGNPTVLGYMWYYNGAQISDDDSRFTISTTNAKDSSTLSIVSATLNMDDATVQCEAYNRIDFRRASVILTIKEDNLTTYIIAALGLIAAAIFVVIVVAFIIWVCYRMNKNKRTVHPSKEPLDGPTKTTANNNLFIGATHMNGGIPNGVVKIENEEVKKEKKHKKKHKKDKKKHKKSKKEKSKVIAHDSTHAPNPLSTRDGDHHALPTITGYRRPGASSRDPGFYPTYPPTMYPLDGHSPLPPHFHPGYGAGYGDPAATMEYGRLSQFQQGARPDQAQDSDEKKKKKKHKHKKEKSKDKE